jgi:hypothetical protein
MIGGRYIEVTVDYRQICVFDPDLDGPYNDWTDEHVRQGFSWRDGAVSFAVDYSGQATIEVFSSSPPVDLAPRGWIVVPFTAAKTVEIGSIASTQVVPLTSGRYALHFVEHDDGVYALWFETREAAEPEVRVETALAKRQAHYLMAASPA